MSFEIKATLTQAMKTAMKQKQKERLGVIRVLLAAVKQREVDDRIEVDDSMLLAILDKQLKQRRESAKIYREAGRDELADQEEFEMTVIQDFLPTALTTDELNKVITDTIASLGASSMQDMGKVMGVLRPQVQGKADMSEVSKLIKQQLS